jgi:hypothetical protein
VRWIAAIAATAAVLSGCGGGEKKTQLTATQWASRADAACKRASTAIADRGWVFDIAKLRTHVPEVTAEARGAIAEIRRLPIPAGSANDIRPFVGTLGDLEAQLDELTRASKALDLDDLERAALTLEGELSAVESSARGAGLRWCLQHDEAEWVPDGIRGPVTAERFRGIELGLLGRSQALARKRGAAKRRGTVKMFRYQFRAVSMLEPPAWALGEYLRYRGAVLELAQLVPSDRRIRTRVRRVNRLHDRFGRAVGVREW